MLDDHTYYIINLDHLIADSRVFPTGEMWEVPLPPTKNLLISTFNLEEFSTVESPPYQILIAPSLPPRTKSQFPPPLNNNSQINPITAFLAAVIALVPFLF